jgi:hypothetical protein
MKTKREEDLQEDISLDDDGELSRDLDDMTYHRLKRR